MSPLPYFLFRDNQGRPCGIFLTCVSYLLIDMLELPPANCRVALTFPPRLACAHCLEGGRLGYIVKYGLSITVRMGTLQYRNACFFGTYPVGEEQRARKKAIQCRIIIS